MTGRLCALLLAGAFVCPIGAIAQTFTGGVTLGYGMGDVSINPPLPSGSFDLNSFTLDGRIAIDLGNGFSVGGRVDRANIDQDLFPVDIAGNLMTLNAAYAFGGGGWVGLYAEDASISIDLLPIDIGSTQYGIEGGYKGAGYAVSAFYGADDDISHFGLAARWTGTPKLTVGGSFTRTNVALFGSDFDVDYFGLAGTYDINDKLNVFAGIGQTSISNADADLTTYGIGVGYDMSGFAKIPMVASIELARSEIGFSGFSNLVDLDTVRIGLTIPFGAGASKAPLNSVADSILNPSHSAISQTILMAF
jgi:hypothetical protein